MFLKCQLTLNTVHHQDMFVNTLSLYDDFPFFDVSDSVASEFVAPSTTCFLFRLSLHPEEDPVAELPGALKDILPCLGGSIRVIRRTL